MNRRCAVTTPTSAALSGDVRFFSPLQDVRWDDFVNRHPRSSVFHTSQWLEALRRTYGYQPIAVGTCGPDNQITNAYVFCVIKSWLTGHRWVSLPFSDHCEPLTDDPDCEDHILSTVENSLREQSLRYFETRPLDTVCSRVVPASLYESTRDYCFHRIDLTPDLETLFRNLHKASIQRKIRRAERERLRYEEGNSQHLLDAFHDLQAITRKHHGLPPQPKAWFQNVLTCVGPAASIRVAYKDELPVASIFTMRHKDTIVYKYGCSNPHHNNLGGTQLLFWNTIKEAKLDNVKTFDLGRSAFDNEGLLTFKDRWGASRTTLRYSRVTCSHLPNTAHDMYQAGVTRTDRLAMNMFSVMPKPLSRAIGALLYRHIG